MNNSAPETGASKSTPTATAVATGTGDAAAVAVAPAIGAMAAASTNSAPIGKPNTGNARKPTADPLPLPDLLSIFQSAARALQEAGLPVSAVNLPVPANHPPRVALILQGIIYDDRGFHIDQLRNPI